MAKLIFDLLHHRLVLINVPSSSGSGGITGNPGQPIGLLLALTYAA